MKPIIDKQGQGVQLFHPAKESECSGEVVYKKILHQDGTEKPNLSFCIFRVNCLMDDK